MPKLLKRHATRRQEAPSLYRSSQTVPDLPAWAAADQPLSPDAPAGVVRCFVDPDELRRLLSLMAGAELVGMLMAALSARS
jgi:hypothetical protein